MKQQGMFDETAADMPLVSGVCLRAERVIFSPPAKEPTPAEAETAEAAQGYLPGISDDADD